LYLLTLFTDLMASRASMSSRSVRFGAVIISLLDPLFRPGGRFTKGLRPRNQRMGDRERACADLRMANV
jgi:hypothetical protein